jgi:glycosyltransferase involved in cell wall biosynthesis
MDWEDPSREVYLTKFNRKLDFLFLPIIGLIEKLSVRVADMIITPSDGFREAFIARRHDAGKIKIVMNAPDKRIFSKSINRKYALSNNKFNILYYGAILQRHGLDIAIKAIRILKDQIPYARLVIVGGGEKEFIEVCRSLAKRLDVEAQINWYSSVRVEEIPKVLQDTAVVVIPNRENCFTKINFPQRIMECGYLKVPVVVSRLPGIEHYVDEASVRFFEPENHRDLAEKIIDLYNSPEKLKTFAENAYRICRKMEWEESYLKIVDDLVKDTPP